MILTSCTVNMPCCILKALMLCLSPAPWPVTRLDAIATIYPVNIARYYVLHMHAPQMHALRMNAFIMYGIDVAIMYINRATRTTQSICWR